MPVILAIQEVEIRKMEVQSQPRQTVNETPSQPITEHSGSYLSSQLLGRLRLGGSWFQARLSKKFSRLHLNRIKLSERMHACPPSYCGKCKCEAHVIQLAQTKSKTLSQK
jgi:hypothetical protein